MELHITIGYSGAGFYGIQPMTDGFDLRKALWMAIVIALGFPFAFLSGCGSCHGENGRDSGSMDSVSHLEAPEQIYKDKQEYKSFGECVEPYSGMMISQNTVLCPSRRAYHLQDKDGGAIHIASSNLTLVGYGVTLQGNGKGTGIS